MVYDSSGITKSIQSKELDTFNMIELETYLYNSKVYHEALADLIQSDLEKLNPSNVKPLQEAFSIKGIFKAIGNAIRTVFSKIWEVIRSFGTVIGSLFQASDQVLVKNVKLLNAKYEMYGKYIKFKAILPRNGADEIMGDCGYEFSNQIINAAKKAKEYIKSFKDNRESSVDGIITEMDSLRGKLFNENSVSEKDFKNKINDYLFLPKKEYIGIDSDLFEMIKVVMQTSPDMISRSWNRECEKEMNTLLKEIKTLEKDYSKDDDTSMSSEINKVKAYMVGCSHIIANIHMTYIQANVKLIRQCRALFMKLIKTIKQPKPEESTDLAN